MVQYFETRVSFDKVMENGAVKKVVESYLADALSFAEAEARTTEELKPYISGDFTVKAAKRTKICEIFNLGAERYYLAKVSFITIDEKTAAEKRCVSQILVGASNFGEAYGNFIEGMRGTMTDFELISLSETPIVEVFGEKEFHK